MGKLGGRFVILLNLAKVLSLDEIALLADIGQGTAERPETAH